MRTMHTGAVGVLLCCLGATSANAHGVVGQRSFIEPFITEDVNPKNELVIVRPEWTQARTGRAFTLGFALEKKLADRFSVAFDSQWLDFSPAAVGEPRARGFDNLGISLKDAFFIDPAHEAIASVALTVTAPIGARPVIDQSDWSFKALLLYGKGFGDLPLSVRYLRPVALQGDAGLEVSIDHAHTTTLAHNLAIHYSIPYLQAAVRDYGLRWPLNDLVPVTEFNFEHGVNGAPRGFSVSVTPGIVYIDGYVELGVAGRFPLNAGANHDFGSGVIGIVDIFIDDLMPWTHWQPFRGFSQYCSAAVSTPGAARSLQPAPAPWK